MNTARSGPDNARSYPGKATPIRRAVTVHIFSVSAIFALIFVVVLGFINWKSAERRHLAQVVSRVDGYHAALTRMIQDFDNAGMREIGEIIRNDRAVAAVHIVSRFNKTILEYGNRNDAVKNAHVLMRTVPDQLDPSFTAATAIYFVNTPDVIEDALSRMVVSTVGALLFCALIAFEINRRLRKTIVAPLSTLHRALQGRESSDEWQPPRLSTTLEISDLQIEIENAFYRTKLANERVEENIQALTNILVNYGIAIRYFDRHGSVTDFGRVTETPVAPVLPGAGSASGTELAEAIRRAGPTTGARVTEIDRSIDAPAGALLLLDFAFAENIFFRVSLFDLADRELAIVVADVTRARQLETQAFKSQKFEAIGQLSSGIAHDFNNLLGIIVGNAELMQLTKEFSEGSVAAIQTACERGARLTHGLLSFARASALHVSQVDLNRTIANLINWSREIIPEHVDVELVLDSGAWRVDTDPSMAENAVLNLVLNACDAMPAGGKLTIETSNLRVDDTYIATRHEMIDSGRYVMLAVTDTGEGIPKRIYDRIFDPFFTTQAPGKGSGVGLSMVQGFMRQTGGAVRVYSEEGKGTSFKLLFPASLSPRQDLQVYDNEAIERCGSANILLVEDERELRKALDAHLTHAGYRVVVAENADDALRRLQSHPEIDVLITDMIMPGKKNGLQLAEEMRRRKADLGVILISGYAQESVVHGNGANAYDIRLSKPIRRRDLIQAVEKALRRAGQR